ncbi:putative methyltransferase [Kingella potus]|uniref:Putative methyltransferase n=1 Tax=Kingella potus TaxID=265175 RepID=A0A377R4E9_9NEIS|nr:class I SAM-dependent methyltransferase [Kingella potus]UOP00065.1 class I SAM-dependent methyltransferase [Kingella potus]STR03356.1 putative methyltransferase [Kingella potus]
MYPEIPTSIGECRQWRNESTQKPPQNAIFLRETNADAVLQNARANIATVFTGDYHNAKQILSALKKRVRGNRPSEKNKKTDNKQQAPADPASAFHRHRLRQSQQSRLINMFAVEIGADFTLTLPRAPDIKPALADIYDQPADAPFLLPLNLLLGFIGAHEWHQKGTDIPALGAKVHVPFGVFSPIRGEYLELIMRSELNPDFQTAFDIGTGSGILAALLAKRGIPRITATDNNPRALICAEANIRRLGFTDSITIQAADLFPEGCADLIVCNPPWLPAKPTSTIETALYDPDHAMLRSFLGNAAAHLNPGGEIWLIMSDIAKHLGLHSSDFLPVLFQTASLHVIETLYTHPAHKKAALPSDPLAFARNREVTALYRLQAANGKAYRISCTNIRS